jgi:hypothetical protein
MPAPGVFFEVTPKQVQDLRCRTGGNEPTVLSLDAGEITSKAVAETTQV